MAQQTRELTVEGAALVDAAAERERAAAQDEFAKVSRSNAHGQKMLYAKSSAAAIIRIHATIDFLAQTLAALGDTGTDDRRRAKALLVMANPVQALQLLQAFAVRRARTNHTGGDTDSQGTLDDGHGAQAGDSADIATPKPFQPHQITPDSRFTCGFDPRRLLPGVVLYLHLYARADTVEVGPLARWEGEAAVATAYVRTSSDRRVSSRSSR